MKCVSHAQCVRVEISIHVHVHITVDQFLKKLCKFDVLQAKFQLGYCIWLHLAVHIAIYLSL